MIESFDILGVKITVTNLMHSCRLLEQWIKEGHKTYVCLAPVATIVDCQADKQYCHVINQAGLVTPDGMPLVWLGRWQGHHDVQRTYGPDLLAAFCELSEQQGYKHYFYGGLPEANKLLVQKLQEKFPRLKIVGHFSPPLRQIGEQESPDILSQINAANPDVLWVGLGSPKQDYWMQQHRALLNVPIMVGVGAAFDFLAGTKKQAPRWMQQSGLEWMFRLCSEPKRLWQRYLVGNTKFICFLLADGMKKIRYR
ncbi:MAG: hypothetical protein A3D10_05630 [Omnitrophica WOR_2 bacterium RIFCSPHIGHO2_02_FULL_48_11]|nr:MAG: hypothetical protein A3D10_05630 [Omnitrophica WOR_2 bacterium RIFCSPHIGHO2_02_FULL_48_11]